MNIVRLPIEYDKKKIDSRFRLVSYTTKSNQRNLYTGFCQHLWLGGSCIWVMP